MMKRASTIKGMNSKEVSEQLRRPQSHPITGLIKGTQD